MTRVKVCGVTNAGELGLCVEAGASALGFVVEYPQEVPWNLTRHQALELMHQVPPFVSRVIVVGGDPQSVIPVIELLRPHSVQLHGNEPLAVTAELVAQVHALGATAIKALRFSVETGECALPGDSPLEAAARLLETGVDAVLIDSYSSARAAGTGHSVDFRMARSIRDALRLPVILAGGLNADNVRQAIAAVAPYAVDVISGVEDASGRKDPAKVRAFIAAVAGAGAPAGSDH